MARNDSDEETVGHGAEKSPAKADGGEKGERQGQESGTVGFWHKDLRHVRGEVFKHWGITSELFNCFEVS